MFLLNLKENGNYTQTEFRKRIIFFEIKPGNFGFDFLFFPVC